VLLVLEAATRTGTKGSMRDVDIGFSSATWASNDVRNLTGRTFLWLKVLIEV
jgi:hypothetical protein